MKTIARVAVGIVALGAFAFPATAANADPGWCGETVTTPGTTITLDSNLYCDGTALTVVADDVTIDLAGFTIKGGPTDPSAHSGSDPRYGGYAVGVHVIGARDTRITGGDIYGFDAGIVADRATALRVDAMTVTAPQYWGLWAINANGVSVERSTVSGTWSPGDDVPTGDGYYPQAGIEIHDSGGISVVDSTLTGIVGNGLLTIGVTGVTVTGTDAIDNGGAGIQSWTTGGAFTVRHSTLEGNEEGIQYDHSGTSGTVTIDAVNASKNREHGVWVTDLKQATLTKVEASGNGGNGIWLSSGIDPTSFAPVAFRATVSGSRADSNGQGGIAFESAGTWTLSNNTASGNHGEGFYASGGTITSSGNIAKGNGTNGFLWDTGLAGTSTSDVASGSHSAGIRVNVGSGHTITIADGVASSGQSYGVIVNSGTAHVIRGQYNVNDLDGIRVANDGTGYLQYVRAVKNGANGVAFVAGSSGWAYKITSSSNDRYGICTDPAASYRNYPPHTLRFNGAGAYGHTCDGYVFPYWWYRP